MDSPNNENYRRELLFSLFEKIKKEHGTLVIGGDFFDFWFDYRTDRTLGYRDIFDKLEELSSNNIEIHYVLGNHDYWDFGYFKKKFNAHTHRGDLKLAINGENILVTHGDGLLSDDFGYRFMRRIIRSKICIFLFNILGGEIGCKLAKKISNTSKKYNHSEYRNKKNDTKKEKIRDEINSYMINNYINNYDTILIGHYHQTGIDNLNNKKKIIYMGDWLNYYTVTCLNKSGWKQFSWGEK